MNNLPEDKPKANYKKKVNFKASHKKVSVRIPQKWNKSTQT